MSTCTLDRLRTRFRSYLSEPTPSGCLLWTGYKDRNGYGKIQVRYMGFRHPCQSAHRIAWWLATGAFPHGAVVMHSCDTPACCNPAHLSLGTHAENQRDKVLRGRSCRGERNGGGRKLTAEDVVDIRRALRCPKPPRTFKKELAEIFDVTTEMIYAIDRRRVWRHI